MIFESPKTYVEAKIFGSDHKVWLTEEEFEGIAKRRAARKEDGFLINDGNSIMDPLVNEDLKEGGEVHLMELSITMTFSEFDGAMEMIGREDWSRICFAGAIPKEDF